MAGDSVGNSDTVERDVEIVPPRKRKMQIRAETEGNEGDFDFGDTGEEPVYVPKKSKLSRAKTKPDCVVLSSDNDEDECSWEQEYVY